METVKRVRCIIREVDMTLLLLSLTVIPSIYKQDPIHKSGSGINVLLCWASPSPTTCALQLEKRIFYPVSSWFGFNVLKFVF